MRFDDFVDFDTFPRPRKPVIRVSRAMEEALLELHPDWDPSKIWGCETVRESQEDDGWYFPEVVR